MRKETKTKTKKQANKKPTNKKRNVVHGGKIVAYRQINLRLKSLRKWQAIIIT